MTYASLEKSLQGGVPVEFYEFWQGTTYWRYTASSRDETFLGDTYASIPISRSGAEISKESKKADLTITVPVDTDAITQFKTYFPEDTMWVRVRRAHRDSNGDPDATAYITFWIGRVKMVEFGQENATITCDPLEAAIDNMFLRYMYQRQCNHALFGSFCGADRTLYTTTVDVVSFTGSVYTVTGTEFTDKISGTYPTGGANWWLSGEAYLNGARRIITATTLTPTVTMTLNYPVPGAVVGSTFTIYAGCDRAATTCRDKFSNSVNFGGFPFVPAMNIFKTGMPEIK